MGWFSRWRKRRILKPYNDAAVVVPLYGAPNDAAAVTAIQALFPTRKVVGFRADHILTGGGSFHCISQQVPSL